MEVDRQDLLDRFWLSLVRSNRSVLFLDYDGTLAPFKINRTKAIPYPGVLPLLQELISTEICRIVVVSGRPVDEIVKLVDSTPLPEIWGSHGYERLKPGEDLQQIKLPDNAKVGLEEAQEAVSDISPDRIERKYSSIAMHWRGLGIGEITALQSRTLESWQSLTEEYSLCLSEFDGGLELRTPDRNKGDAVKKVLSEESYDVVYAYLGDDITDEDAFEVVGNNGLSILVREERRETRADVWLKPPEELLGFLRKYLEKIR